MPTFIGTTRGTPLEHSVGRGKTGYVICGAPRKMQSPTFFLIIKNFKIQDSRKLNQTRGEIWTKGPL